MSLWFSLTLRGVNKRIGNDCVMHCGKWKDNRSLSQVMSSSTLFHK